MTVCVPFVVIEGESYRKRQKPKLGQKDDAEAD